MRLADHVELFSLGGIPMAGNLETGGVIGLTRAGETLCRKMSERDVTTREVPAECESLVEHLQCGGYLASSERPSTGRGHVRSAYLHVTQRCNLRCKFCYSEGDDRNLLPDPSAESLARAIGLLASLGTKRLVISGGEPFLRDDLPDIARSASMAGIEEIVVLTNGLLVSEKNVASLAGIVSCVGVAFDGCSNNATAHLRGGAELRPTRRRSQDDSHGGNRGAGPSNDSRTQPGRHGPLSGRRAQAGGKRRVQHAHRTPLRARRVRD